MYTLSKPTIVKLQEVLDKTAKALHDQKAICTDRDGDCANYNTKGQRCAFGWVMYLLGVPSMHMNSGGSYLTTIKHVLERGDYEHLRWLDENNLDMVWNNIQNLHDAWGKHATMDAVDALGTLVEMYPQINFDAWKTIANGDWLK